MHCASSLQGLWPAAPIGLSAVMYQNDGHLRAAGLDPSSPAATLDELRDAAEAIAAADIEGLDTPVVMRLDAWLADPDEALSAEDPAVAGPETAG